MLAVYKKLWRVLIPSRRVSIAELEYSNRTVINCGDLPDSNVAGMGSAIACLSSAHQ